MSTWTTPATVAVGDPATAAWANTFVRDNWGDNTWVSPTLVNSWTNTQDAGFRRMGSLIILRGAIGGGNANTVAFTLPAGYRPTNDRRFIVVNYSTGDTAEIYITSAGVVTVTGSGLSNGQTVMLDGVVFSMIQRAPILGPC